MKILGLDGRTYSWSLTGYEASPNDTRPRSNAHILARQLLKEQFPTYKLLEEVPLPSTNLFCDFFLPLKRLMVEVNGQQHSEYIKYFHNNLAGFRASQSRDAKKQEFCDMNNIRLVIFPHNESVDQWKARLYG